RHGRHPPFPPRRSSDLAVPFMATAFGTFLLRQGFMQIPRELWDAARIDGASSFRFLRSMVIPLSRPALATVGIYGFLSTYNQYRSEEHTSELQSPDHLV